MSESRDGLGADLDRLAEADPEVRTAARRLDWMAQKAAMGWPTPKRIRKSPLPEDSSSSPRSEETVPMSDVTGRWPYPGDGPIARARRTAHAYRAALYERDPTGCALLNERMSALGSVEQHHDKP